MQNNPFSSSNRGYASNNRGAIPRFDTLRQGTSASVQRSCFTTNWLKSNTSTSSAYFLKPAGSDQASNARLNGSWTRYNSPQTQSGVAPFLSPAAILPARRNQNVQPASPFLFTAPARQTNNSRLLSKSADGGSVLRALRELKEIRQRRYRRGFQADSSPHTEINGSSSRMSELDESGSELRDDKRTKLGESVANTDDGIARKRRRLNMGDSANNHTLDDDTGYFFDDSRSVKRKTASRVDGERNIEPSSNTSTWTGELKVSELEVGTSRSFGHELRLNTNDSKSGSNTRGQRELRAIATRRLDQSASSSLERMMQRSHIQRLVDRLMHTDDQSSIASSSSEKTMEPRAQISLPPSSVAAMTTTAIVATPSVTVSSVAFSNCENVNSIVSVAPVTNNEATQSASPIVEANDASSNKIEPSTSNIVEPVVTKMDKPQVESPPIFSGNLSQANSNSNLTSTSAPQFGATCTQFNVVNTASNAPFTFGGSGSNAQAAEKSPWLSGPAPFAFGAVSSKPADAQTNAAPKFAFGAPAAPASNATGAVSFGTAVTKPSDKSAPTVVTTSAFAFGTATATSSTSFAFGAPNAGQFGTNTAATITPAKPAAFAFSTPTTKSSGINLSTPMSATTSNATTTSTFTFGASLNKDAANAVSNTANKTTSRTGTSTSVVTPVATSALFGMPNGSATTNAATKSAFVFGAAANAAPPPQPAVSIATSNAVGSGNTVFNFSKTNTAGSGSNSGTSGFAFGSKPQIAAGSQSASKSGAPQTPTTTANGNSMFFGAASTNKAAASPSAFKATTQQNNSSAGFAFGANATNSKTQSHKGDNAQAKSNQSNFVFGAANKPPPATSTQPPAPKNPATDKPVFSFGTQQTSANQNQPQQFQFGAPKTNSNSFQFGAGAGAAQPPSNNLPSFISQPLGKNHGSTPQKNATPTFAAVVNASPATNASGNANSFITVGNNANNAAQRRPLAAAKRRNK